MTVKRGLQLALILLLLDRHAEDVCGPLQEGDVVLAELAFGFAVDFQDAERRAVALENNVHRAVDAVLDEQVGCPEALLIFKVVRNNRLTGAQSIAGRRGQIGPHACYADDALAPADSSAYEKAVLGRDVFHHFAVFSAQSLGRHTHGVIEHADEARALKRQHAQFSKELLLANTLTKSAGGQLVGLIVAWRASTIGSF